MSFDSTTILESNQVVTGVRRAEGKDKVVLTGAAIIDGASNALLYLGPVEPTDSAGIHVLTPQIHNRPTTTGSTFYGPDTAATNASLPPDTIRAVGTCLYPDSVERNHGMIYEGNVEGKGGWSELDVPDKLVGRPVWNTIPHSTMGNLVVGNYDLEGVFESANAFLFNIANNRWTLFAFEGCDLITAYGIWDNGDGSFTIAGGARDGQGINRGFLVSYWPATDSFGTPALYSFQNRADLLTHFEGITRSGAGFHLAGQAKDPPKMGTLSTPFLAMIDFAGGVYGEARWFPFAMDGMTVVTGNTVYQETLMGMYLTGDDSPKSSYAATFKP